MTGRLFLDTAHRVAVGTVVRAHSAYLRYGSTRRWRRRYQQAQTTTGSCRWRPDRWKLQYCCGGSPQQARKVSFLPFRECLSVCCCHPNPCRIELVPDPRHFDSDPFSLVGTRQPLGARIYCCGLTTSLFSLPSLAFQSC